MTDSDKLLAIASFMLNEGIRVEDTYKLTQSRRTIEYRGCDQLDYLELIQLRDRWEYFMELDVAIGNILFDQFRSRPPWYPLDKRYH